MKWPWQHQQHLRSQRLIDFPHAIYTDDEWKTMRSQLVEMVNRTFSNETVVLDGRLFINCAFYRCVIEFNGTAPFDTEGGLYLDDVTKANGVRSGNPAFSAWTSLLVSFHLIGNASVEMDGKNLATSPFAHLPAKQAYSRFE